MKNKIITTEFDPKTAFDSTVAFDLTKISDPKRLFVPKTVYKTPCGTSLFPHLTEPQTTFKKEGEFSTQIYFPPEVEAVVLERLPVTAAKEFGLAKLDEGVSRNSPLRRPVKWWIERRFGEPVISFKVEARPAELCGLYGPSILDQIGGDQTVEVIVENYLSERWSRIRQPLDGPAPGEEPRPIVMCVEQRESSKYLVETPTVPKEWPDPDFHVIDDDIDIQWPVGRPVHWRIELRGSEQVHCSHYQATQKEAVRFLGDGSLPYIQGNQSIQFVFENYPSDSWRSTRTPIGPTKTLRLSDEFLDYVRRAPWNRNEYGF